MKILTFIFSVFSFLILFSFHSSSLIFSQVVIKEKVNINPQMNKRSEEDSIRNSLIEDCPCNQCIPENLYISFSPSYVTPGSSTIIKLWLVLNEYPFDENDVFGITISITPNVGSILPLGSGEYLYTAPDTLSIDTAFVTITYQSFYQHCAIWPKEKPTHLKTILNCIDCPPPGWSVQINYFASEQLCITRDSLFVDLSSQEVFPGDTVDVIIKKRLPDGSLVDFDSSQSFEVATLEGCVLGNILVEDSLSNYFYDVHQPIKFVVADTVNTDSALILLRVGLIELNQTEKKKTYLETNCFSGYFQSQTYQNARATVGARLKIVSPTKSDIMWITEEPQMPVINCIAKYNPLYLRPIKYEWKFVVWRKYQRRDTRGNTICERISRSEFQGLSYSEGNGYTFWTVSFIVDSGYFDFKAVQNKQSKYYPKPYYGCNGEVNYWYDDNQDIFTGGEIFFELTAKDYQTGFVLCFSGFYSCRQNSW